MQWSPGDRSDIEDMRGRSASEPCRSASADFDSCSPCVGRPNRFPVTAEHPWRWTVAMLGVDARGRHGAPTGATPPAGLSRMSCRPIASPAPAGMPLGRAAVFGDCEEITFNAETAEAPEKKCPRISQRALRALRSNVAFFHRLFGRGAWSSNPATPKKRCAPHAAAAIGDDRLQKMATGRVAPDRLTHGTPRERVRWFSRLMETGDPRECDTFARSTH